MSTINVSKPKCPSCNQRVGKTGVMHEWAHFTNSSKRHMKTTTDLFHPKCTTPDGIATAKRIKHEKMIIQENRRAKQADHNAKNREKRREENEANKIAKQQEQEKCRREREERYQIQLEINRKNNELYEECRKEAMMLEFPELEVLRKKSDQATKMYFAKKNSHDAKIHRELVKHFHMKIIDDDGPPTAPDYESTESSEEEDEDEDHDGETEPIDHEDNLEDEYGEAIEYGDDEKTYFTCSPGLRHRSVENHRLNKQQFVKSMEKMIHIYDEYEEIIVLKHRYVEASHRYREYTKKFELRVRQLWDKKKKESV